MFCAPELALPPAEPSLCCCPVCDLSVSPGSTVVLKQRQLREFHGSGAQTRLCSVTFTFESTVCYQRHVGCWHGTDVSPQPNTRLFWALQTLPAAPASTAHLCMLRSFVPVSVPCSRAETEKGDPFFWRDSTAVSRPESVFPAFPKPFLGQERCDLCPKSSASELSMNC